MGRYLALGVATSFEVRKANDWYSSQDFNVNKNKNKIIKQASKFLDMKQYDCEEGDNFLRFRLKKDYFNQNIYSLLKEIRPVLDCERYFLSRFFGYKDDITIEKVIDKYPIKLNIYDETYAFEYEYEKERLLDEFYVECNGETTTESGSVPDYSKYWLFDDEISDNVNVSFGHILIWQDCNKYAGEDEVPMLRLLNTFSRNYFKNPLAKNILFYVCG